MHVKVGRIVSVINCHCFPFEKFYRTILYVRDCASSTNYIYMLYVVCYRMPFHITVPVHIFARSKVHLMVVVLILYFRIYVQVLCSKIDSIFMHEDPPRTVKNHFPRTLVTPDKRIFHPHKILLYPAL